MTDTIAAVATAKGQAGVGVIRLSGPTVKAIAVQLLGKLPTVRQASYAAFRDHDGKVIDHGIAIHFAAPHSFTGEDILELQGHGGPVIMDMLLERCVALGARLARPGEFSERAFLNDKIDLVQAEAIADLIASQSRSAARLAVRSMEGELSRRVYALNEQLIYLRMYVEAAIDFPEEEIDFLSDGKVASLYENLRQAFSDLIAGCQQGSLLREGINVVIAGRPNAGKSSLLNALSGREVAIVTDVPGTTRDILREYLVLDGLPIHLIDTAGLRDATDRVEAIGIAKAKQQIHAADLILLVMDATTEIGISDEIRSDGGPGRTLIAELFDGAMQEQLTERQIILVKNKMDLLNKPTGKESENCVAVCAHDGAGIEALIALIKDKAGLHRSDESLVLARRRHIDALVNAEALLHQGIKQLQQYRAGELFADDLRQAQRYLNEITGEFTADDLLGRIFSSFCIGK